MKSKLKIIFGYIFIFVFLFIGYTNISFSAPDDPDYETPGYGYPTPPPYEYESPAYGTPAYGYPTPAAYGYETPGYGYPTPYGTPSYGTPSYGTPYGTPYSYESPPYSYPTPPVGYNTPTPAYGYEYPTPSYVTPVGVYGYQTPGGTYRYEYPYEYEYPTPPRYGVEHTYNYPYETPPVGYSTPPYSSPYGYETPYRYETVNTYSYPYQYETVVYRYESPTYPTPVYDYETPPSGMTGTLTPSTISCSISIGSSTCNINFSWRVINPVSTTAVTKPVNVTVASGHSGINVPFAVSNGNLTFYLYNNSVLLDQQTVSGSCVPAAIWDGSKCVAIPAMSGDLVASSPSCVIPLGGSYCDIDFSWTTTNPIAISAVTRNPSNTVVGNGNNKVNFPLSVKYNSETFYLYNNAILLDQVTVSSSCIAGTSWGGVACVAVSGVLTPSVPSCAISVGSSNCLIDFSWTVSNPIGTSYIRDNPGDGVIYTATGHIGNNVPFTIGYGSKTFYLKNGTTLLDQDTVIADCEMFSGWDGARCRAIPQHMLTVVRPTSGGDIESEDGFIRCGSVCRHSYGEFSGVTLVAKPSSSYWKFDRWSSPGGECAGSGNGPCRLTMNSAKGPITAIFVPRAFIYKEF